MSKDTIFRSDAAGKTPFRFDDAVAQVFPDMINRSVPGYGVSLDGISLIAQRYVPEGGRVYDLGCTLGAATLAVAHGIGDRSATLIGIDNSEPMIRRCREDSRFAALSQTIEFAHADIRETVFDAADLVILNYTLQFIEPDHRKPLLTRLYEALRPGGALVIAEKFVFDDSSVSERINELHLDFKRAHHYSELEIAGKRAAIENVLIPDSRETHERRLREVGFGDVVLWHAALNFGALLAFKPK